MLFRSSLLRRLTGCVLALSFGLYSAESLLADTHDGDATHEELALVDGAAEHAAFHVSHGDVPSAASVVMDAEPSDPHPGERAPGESGHEDHACHCAHVHGGWLQDPPSCEVQLAALHAGPDSLGDHAPASRDAEPQLRPPID